MFCSNGKLVLQLRKNFQKVRDRVRIVLSCAPGYKYIYTYNGDIIFRTRGGAGSFAADV